MVVSGLGNAQGTGAACARLFAKQPAYKVALISRPRQEVDDLCAEIKAAGGCVSWPVPALQPIGSPVIDSLCGGMRGSTKRQGECMLIHAVVLSQAEVFSVEAYDYKHMTQAFDRIDKVSRATGA